MFAILKKLIFRFIPIDSLPYKVIDFLYRKYSHISNYIVIMRDATLYRYFLRKFNVQLIEGADITFNRYIANYFSRPGDYDEMKKIIPVLKYKPLISVLMPVYNAPPHLLRMAIESLLNQIYDRWELCIADDSSTSNETIQVLKEYEYTDQRIKILFKNKNEHICKTTQAALKLATGEFIGLLDHDDCLTPDALYQNVLVMNSHPKADMIYSDEAIVDAENKIIKFLSKPDWSPETFLSTMYTCHFSVFRTALARKVGGFRPGYDGSQDYDITLRVTENTNEIYHIPKYIYYWRSHGGSVLIDVMKGGGKNYAFEVAKSALNEALSRRKEPGFVEHDKAFNGKYHIHYDYKNMPSVEILVHYTGNQDELVPYITSIISKTDYKECSFSVFLPEAHDSALTRQQLNTDGKSGIQVYPASVKSYNQVISGCASDFLLFIDSSINFNNGDPRWLTRLVEQGMRKKIGAVTPLLVEPHRRVYSSGLVLNEEELYENKYGDGSVDPITDLENYHYLVFTHNVAAVPPECFLVKKKHFMSMGGFDGNYSHPAALSLDLSLRILSKGMRNLCVPFVHLTIDLRNAHFSRMEKLVTHKDALLLKRKWNSFFEHDPYECKNFTIMRKYFRA